MKKIIATLIAGVLVLGLAGASQAAVADWELVMNVKPAAGAVARQAYTYVGVKTTASDTLGADDTAITGGMGSWVELVSYNAAGTSAYYKNYQTSFSAPQIVKTWAMTLDGNFTGSNNVLVNFLFSSTAKAYTGGYSSFAVYNADGSVMKDNTGKDMIFSGTQGAGTTTAPLFAKTFAFDGTPQTFNIVASTVVPEPSSILAMLSGLAGMAGFAIRRRK